MSSPAWHRGRWWSPIRCRLLDRAAQDTGGWPVRRIGAESAPEEDVMGDKGPGSKSKDKKKKGAKADKKK
jgi:hypothetical protein